MQTNPHAKYLLIEEPYTQAVIDFMGTHPVSVKLQIEEGKLWVCAVTQDAYILIEETVQVPEAESDPMCMYDDDFMCMYDDDPICMYDDDPMCMYDDDSDSK